MIVVLMGVSGSGKTTIGTLLAKRMHTVFADADDYHSAANKAKMASGHALDDADRQPWLESLNEMLRGWAAADGRGVLACSALKDAYRKTLMQGMAAETVKFILLDGSRELIAERLSVRRNHYMNPKLLDSQLATLEPPPDGLRVANDKSPEAVVDEIMRDLCV